MARITIFIILLYFCSATGAQNDFYGKLADSSLTLTEVNVSYDPAYYSIPYPMGDVPAGKGVCTDVVIRAYRMFGIDLQKEVHEDMSANFSEYPDIWGLSAPDPNIDHRRVPNLMAFFSRHGREYPVSAAPGDYRPGDIVCWDLGGGITHIGIVSGLKAGGSERHMIIHNIGGGQVLADCLFDFRIIGHYRYRK